MKVTPLEIRKKSFEKEFRGYDKDEVNAYLVSLSQAWEKVMDQNKELTIKLESAEKEIAKLREIENSLFKTLKTAEDTGANMIEQANKTAELHMKETQMKTEGLLNEAKSRAKELMEEADDYARSTLVKMEDELKNLASSYKDLESQRENLIDELTRLTNESLEKLNRSRAKMKSFDVSSYLKKTKVDSFIASIKEGAQGGSTTASEKPVQKVQDETAESPDSVSQPESEEKETKSQSFFDNI